MKMLIKIVCAMALASGVAQAGQITKVRFKETGLEVSQSAPLPVMANMDRGKRIFAQNITVFGQGVNTFTQLEMPPNTSTGVVFRNPVAPEIEFPLDANTSAIGQVLTVKVKYLLGDANTFRIKVYGRPVINDMSITDLAGKSVPLLNVGVPVFVTLLGNNLAEVTRRPGKSSFFDRPVDVKDEQIVSASQTEFKIRVTPKAPGRYYVDFGSIQHTTGAIPGVNFSTSPFLRSGGAKFFVVSSLPFTK